MFGTPRATSQLKSPADIPNDVYWDLGRATLITMMIMPTIDPSPHGSEIAFLELDRHIIEDDALVPRLHYASHGHWHEKS